MTWSLCLFVIACISIAAQATTHDVVYDHSSTGDSPLLVFFDHDGGVDDFVSLDLLASDPRVAIIGLYVTPGDTIMRYAVPATRALLGKLNKVCAADV
jgi:hypothetical protein